MCTPPAPSLLADSFKMIESPYFPSADVPFAQGSCSHVLAAGAASSKVKFALSEAGCWPCHLSQPVLMILASVAIDAAKPLLRWAAEHGVCSI